MIVLTCCISFILSNIALWTVDIRVDYGSSIRFSCFYTACKVDCFDFFVQVSKQLSRCSLQRSGGADRYIRVFSEDVD